MHPFPLRLAPAAALCLALGAAVPSPTAAQSGATAEARAELRDELFTELKTAGSEPEARLVEERIWRFWTTGPTDAAEQMFEDAMGRRRSFDYAGALAMLDMLVEAAPDWSEAWNQRAFIHFLREEYDASLEDIERTLELEPKHFGALAGKAHIMLQTGRPAEAQKALRRAVEIHPWLRERVLLEDPPGEDI